MRALFHLLNGAASVVYDTSAQAFFTRHATAGGTLTSGQKDAINTFVTSLKSAGVYTKATEIWPVIGGTAATHALGLKGAYDLTFTGSPTHSSTGIDWDGSTQKAATGIATNTFTVANYHLSIYMQEDPTSGYELIGSTAASNTDDEAIYPRANTTGRAYFNSIGGGNASINELVSATPYYAIASSTASGPRLYRNGTLLVSSSTAATGSMPSGQTFQINPRFGQTTKVSLATIGLSLSDTEAAALSAAVNALQTALSRNVY